MEQENVNLQEKTQENAYESTLRSGNSSNGGNTPPPFVDNRPETLEQKNLQNTLKTAPTTLETQAFQGQLAASGETKNPITPINNTTGIKESQSGDDNRSEVGGFVLSDDSENTEETVKAEAETTSIEKIAELEEGGAVEGSKGDVNAFVLSEEGESDTDKEVSAAGEVEEFSLALSDGAEAEVGEETIEGEGGETEEKGTEGEGEGEAAGGGAIEAPIPPPINPLEDPDFIGVQERIGEQGEQHATHEDAGLLADSAQLAAPLAANETMGLAEVQQVEQMDVQEPEAFNGAAFKEMLLERINAILPRTEEEADDFEENDGLGEVSEAAEDGVEQEKERAGGAIETAAEEEPDTNEVVEREVEEMDTPEPGELLTDLNVGIGMPDSREETYIEQPIDDRVNQVEDQMAVNEITDEQLANSNEPTFIEALNQKESAKEESAQAPLDLRMQEQGILTNAQTGAVGTNEEGLTEMFTDRERFLSQVMENQQESSTDNAEERARVAGEIHDIYEQTKTDVDAIFSNLDTTVQDMFDAAANRAKYNFLSYVNNQMEAYKDERYSGLEGALTWVGDAFTGLPDEVNAFYEEGRNRYIAEMDRSLTSIANFIAGELNAAKKCIADGRQAVVDYVEKLPEDLRGIGQQAASTIQSQFDALDSSIDSKQGELVNNLAQQYADNLNQVDEAIKAMQEANKGLIDMVLDAVGGIIEIILEIKRVLTDIINGAIEVIGAIIADPIGFLGNLIEGVSQGINNFVTNISDHLLTGLIEWLTGALGGAGITLPENLFSFEGVLDLVAQSLGLTWEYVREKAVYAIGEDAVSAIEKGFEVFQILQRDGLAGVWEYIQTQLADLQALVIDGIKEFLISSVIQAGVEWLLGLLTPAGAFIKAAMAIIDIVKFFIENASQIAAFVQSIIDSMAAVAAGDVGFVAQSVEEAMARTVPLIIGFMASLLGIDGLAEKVQTIIMGVRTRIDQAIDGMIDKAKDWFKGNGKNRRNPEEEEAEGEQQNDPANVPDNRTPEQKRADFDKGMNEGMTALAAPNKTTAELQQSLQTIKLKYRMDELNGLLLKEEAEQHTWTLKGKLGDNEVMQQVVREPSKAETEEDVSDADREKHEQFGKEIEAELMAMKPTEEESFEQFRERVKAKAIQLEQEYQPRLTAGIKVDVEFTSSKEEDQTDGTFDLKITIAPNNFIKTIILYISSLMQGKKVYLKDWLDQKGETGHQLKYEGNYLVANNALDMTDAFWEDLKENDPNTLLKLIQTSKALENAKFIIGDLDNQMQEFIDQKTKTSGGRMRFRHQIGPTPEGNATLETYFKKVIEGAYVGGVPDWLKLEKLQPLNRQRLYDLANANRKEELDRRGIAWASQQNPSSVSNFVNYVEYYHANIKTLEDQAKSNANKKMEETIELEKNNLGENDQKAIDEQILKNKIATANKKLAKKLGKYKGILGKGNSLESSDVEELAKDGVKVTVNASIKDLQDAIITAAEESVKGNNETSEDEINQAKLEVAKDKVNNKVNLYEIFLDEATRRLEEILANEMKSDIEIAASESSNDSNIDGNSFWKKKQQEQKVIIESAAKKGIAFTGPDSAAYHAQKHYKEIEGTEDKAANGGNKVTAYIKSANKTIRFNQKMEVQQGQLYNHPSFIFFRTIPAASDGGKDQTMKAIVVVFDNGDIRITTYMQA